jgi:hypothetical protein
LRFNYTSEADERPYLFWQVKNTLAKPGDFDFGFYDDFYRFKADSTKIVLSAREGVFTIDDIAKFGYFSFQNKNNPARLRLDANYLGRRIDIAVPDSLQETYQIILPQTQGLAGQVLHTDGNAQAYWDDPSGGGGGLDTATLAFRYVTAQSNTSLAIPAGCKSVEIHAVGGGGGGGGGRRGAAGTVRLGGGGGGAGGYSWGAFSVADDLGSASTLYLTVGAGGTAGTRATTNDTHGGSGGDGGATFVGTSSGPGDIFIRAFGGTGGLGSANGLGGASVAGSLMLGGQGGTSADATTRNSASSATTSGGGAGGLIRADNTFVDGGSAGQANMGSYNVLAGGSDPNFSGQTPTLIQAAKFGQGGSGGGARNEGNAPGGNGVRGGGGGGGGPSTNGQNSGTGGIGGAGYLLITFHF